MNYTIKKSLNFKDRNNVHETLVHYLEDKGFDKIRDEFSKKTFGSDLGTVVLVRDIYNFETQINLGTSDETFYKEFLQKIKASQIVSL